MLGAVVDETVDEIVRLFTSLEISKVVTLPDHPYNTTKSSFDATVKNRKLPGPKSLLRTTYNVFHRM